MNLTNAEQRATYSTVCRGLSLMGPIQSPYALYSQADQEWRMGFADGLDVDPCTGSPPGAYRVGYRQGVKLARLIAEGAPRPAVFPLPAGF